MLQIARGDRDAAAQLARRNAPVVDRFIVRVLRDEHRREDVVQEVLIRVIEAAPRYQPTAKFTTWLYRIATNVALKHLTADKKTWTNADTEVLVNTPTETQSGPESSANAEEMRQKVVRALRLLPPPQRVALTLYQYEQLTYQQIADVMEVSVEAIRGLLRRARDTLRENLSEFR